MPGGQPTKYNKGILEKANEYPLSATGIKDIPEAKIFGSFDEPIKDWAIYKGKLIVICESHKTYIIDKDGNKAEITDAST